MRRRTPFCLDCFPVSSGNFLFLACDSASLTLGQLGPRLEEGLAALAGRPCCAHELAVWQAGWEHIRVVQGWGRGGVAGQLRGQRASDE